jgi:hypothetical protein
MRFRQFLVIGLILFLAVPAFAQSPYAKWTNGFSTDPNYFPIAVWLQNTKNAQKYQAVGINLYVGLYRGPTMEQLDDLKKAGMRVVASQRRASPEIMASPVVAAWMHGDEPDNAQSLPQPQKGYGPPILPSVIQSNYTRIKEVDLSRPVLLNLGQGVAYDQYIGRGVRRNHPEDYPEYIKGSDVVSFDIYPVVHETPEIAGRLEYVAKGVERLVKWTNGEKPVWNCIECTRISNRETKATPAQVRTEVWMALIHGSRGLIYFVHQFEPTFREAALLDDPEMVAGVTALNAQIRELAPVLNSPTIPDAVTVKSSADDVPIAAMVKRHGDATYLFTVAMRNYATRGSFKLAGVPAGSTVEVLGESRTISPRNGQFADNFKPYEVHLYRIKAMQ